MSRPTIVVKLGGEVVAGEALDPIVRDIASLGAGGTRVVVVHGGGPQTSKLQEALGQKPVKIAGRRVTDEAALDAVKMVVAGKLNVDLCAALGAVGVSPVGLHGASALAIEATKRPPRVYAGAGDAPVDLGLVGDVTRVNLELVGLLVDRGYVPVIPCLGASADGQVYNINADVVASRVAAELGADGLFLVSDVRGVLLDVADPTSRIGRLTVDAGRDLIARGIVTRGMIPKLEESFAALAAGVRRIHIVGGLEPGDLAREAATPGKVGTAIFP